MVEEPPMLRSPKPPWGRWRLILGFAAITMFLALFGTIWTLSSWMSEIPAIPEQDALWRMRRTPGVSFLDHDGTFIAARGAKYGARVSLGELPAFIPKAFLAAEDRRFYSHGGIDPVGILRAAWRDIVIERAAEGGSTIAQQLARTLFLNSKHSLKRKVQEAILATRLEDQLGKDGVLDLYLNRTYFGSGAYGLDAASHSYFGKRASELSLSEVAVLAALPNAPTRLAPTSNMAGAWSRARRVLKIMSHEGWVTSGEETKAELARPELAPSAPGEGDWSYVLDQASSRAESLLDGAGGDLIVRLTVESKLQAAGVAAVRDGVLGDGRGRDVSQGAMVVLASDGAVRVMVGGLDHHTSAFNRVIQAKRQPGSAFKAFVFGAAMEAGDKPTDIRDDSPISREGWTPENYGGKFLGPVTLAKALALSINSVAVRLTLEVGPAQVAAFARRCGLNNMPAEPGDSIALGAYEVTQLELASAYQVFQNGGSTTTPYLVESISDTQGRTLYSHTSLPPVRVLDSLYASRMVRMLEGVVTSGTGAGAAIGRPVAGKTGTSQHWRDAWFVGFTPDLLAAVWVGNDDGRPMNKVTGGEIPTAIWKRFMSVAEARQPILDFVWLQPEPIEPPSDDVNNNLADGATSLEDPLKDAEYHGTRPLPKISNDLPSNPDPDKTVGEPPPEDSSRMNGRRRPDDEDRDRLPSSPPSL